MGSHDRRADPAAVPADYAVRDAVPLTPAGTIRVLDAVEQRLQTGRDVGGAVAVLRRLGVRFLVLRNDLDTASAGQPSVTYARSAVRSTPDVELAKGFGLTRIDPSGERVFPVEVYDIGKAAPLAVTQPVSDTVAVSGGPEDLLAVADAGVDGLAVLDGHRVPGVDPGRRVVTDGYRARERWFGATRGRDSPRRWRRTSSRGRATTDRGTTSPVMRSRPSPAEWRASARARRLPPPTPWPACVRPTDPPRSSTATRRPRGSLSTTRTPPSRSASTARASVSSVRVDVLADRERYAGLGVATRLEARTDAGRVQVDVPASGRVEIPLPGGVTRTLAVEVIETDDGDPAGVLTGSRRRRPRRESGRRRSSSGPTTAPSSRTPSSSPAGFPARTGVSTRRTPWSATGEGGRDGEAGAVLARRVTATGEGPVVASGTLDVSRWATDPAGLGVPGVAVRASSSRTASLAGRPEGVVDGDERTAWSPAPDDASPTLTLTLDEPADVGGLTLRARRGWMARHRPFVEVRLDDREAVVRASVDGRLAVSGRDVGTVSIRVLPLLGRSRGAPASLEVEELGLSGTELPRPRERLSRPCGEGPELTVDGVSVPTRMDGPRSALWGRET